MSGLFASTIITNFARALGVFGSGWVWLIIAVVYGAVGYLLWNGSVKSTFFPMLTAYLLIPVGVVVDVTIDFSYHNSDRNLFPFEILMYLAVAWLPLFIGALLAKKFNPHGVFGGDGLQH